MKTVDTVREGGIVAFITSQGVLNAEQGRPVREWLMKRCDVVSAVRFPNNLFIDHAGTEVGSDLIIWQKKAAAGELTPSAAGFHRIPQAVERYSGEQPVPNVRPRDTYRRKGRHRPLRKTRDGVHARGRHRGYSLDTETGVLTRIEQAQEPTAANAAQEPTAEDFADFGAWTEERNRHLME